MRPAVHSDAIGALASIRPGMILSGGRDKVNSNYIKLSVYLFLDCHLYIKTLNKWKYLQIVDFFARYFFKEFFS